MAINIVRSPQPIQRTWSASVWVKGNPGYRRYLVTGSSGPGNAYRRLYATHRDQLDSMLVDVSNHRTSTSW